MNDLGFGLMMFGLGFLLGFKICAMMERKHLAKMKAIWRKIDSITTTNN